MLLTQAALIARLASAGVTKVAVIDDAFDEQKTVALASGTDVFLAEVDANPDWSDYLRNIGIKCDAPDSFTTDGIIELWRKRGEINGPLGDAVRVLFQNSEQKLIYPCQVAENLRKLDLNVECFDMPVIPAPNDPRLKDVQLVFLDYDLEGDDKVETGSRELRSHAIARALAKRRGDTPFLVLFSSLPGVSEEANRFRDGAFYLRGSFLFLHKSDAANFDTLCSQLEPSCIWSRDVGHFQFFFAALRERLKEVAISVEQSFLKLDIQDYAHFQHVALQADGAPLGEYMLDLFGAVLSHEFRNGSAVQDGRHALDKLDLTKQHLPFQTQPTAPLERIYRSVLTEPGISKGPAPSHPRSVMKMVSHNGIQKASPPLLNLGDIFANGSDQPVYIVVNPSCDLQYSPTRKPKVNASVYLLPGALESLDLPASRPDMSERLRWLNYRGTNYRVIWSQLEVITVALGDFNAWQARGGFYRIARLSLPFSLALQQSWIANLGRVGLPTCPPIHDAHDLEIFVADPVSKTWVSSGDIQLQEAIVAVHPADTNETVQFCLTIKARDYLYQEVSKIAGGAVSDRQRSAAVLLGNTAIWWDLVTHYALLESKSNRISWSYKPAAAPAALVLCLLNSEPLPSDFSLKHTSVIMVLRPSK